MARTVDTKEYLDMVRGLLAEGKTHVPVPVAGVSMTPFLHPGDTVYLDLPDSPLKRGDIVLYTRPGGQYVLHRIHSPLDDGVWTIVGDAQQVLEPVPEDRILARVTEVNRGGTRLNPGSLLWRLFATVWLWLPLRRAVQAGYGKLKRKTH